MLKDRVACVSSFLGQKSVMDGTTVQITFPDWPISKMFLFPSAFIPSFLPLFAPFLSLPLFTRWGSEPDGRPVLRFGLILCCCREKDWRPSSLCAIFSGLQVPGARQSLQVSLPVPFAKSSLSNWFIAAVYFSNIYINMGHKLSCVVVRNSFECVAKVCRVWKAPNYVQTLMGVKTHRKMKICYVCVD